MSIRAVPFGPLLVALLLAGAARGQDVGAPAGTVTAPADPAAMMRRYDARTRVIRPCPRAQPGEVVVCARPDDEQTRYRLPLPEERERADTGPIRGEVPRASAAPVRQGSCGVVGQPYGCTGGLPVTGAVMLVGKIVAGLVDPDGDHEPPPPLPERFVGAGEH